MTLDGQTEIDPGKWYRERVTARAAEMAQLQRRHVLLGHARLALVIIGVVIAWSPFHAGAISRWWLLVVVAAFVVVARLHSVALQRRSEAQRATTFIERGLARIEERWAELPARAAQVNTIGSLFADDLDLFRRGGLFHLLDTARTSAGSDSLSSWLLAPAPRDVIVARQKAVQELRGLPELREQLASRGAADFEKLDVHALAGWATTPAEQIPEWLGWMAPVLVAVTLAAAVWFFATDKGLPLLGMLFLDWAISRSLKGRMKPIFLNAERASGSLRLASVLIALWENQTLSCPLLARLRRTLGAEQDSAAESAAESATGALSRFARLAGMMEQRANMMVQILDSPFLFSVQLGVATQRWRRRHAGSLESWLRALAELEALTSLATYSFEHPKDPFPEISEESACYEARELGHPLIADAKCVRNDVALDATTSVLLVSGSNMSGKSTLLRAIGINAVMAMAGAPVRAASLRMTPLHVGASIQVNDSLREGRSRFYSEILRLRAVCALAEEMPPALFLLDELLDGTNSSDRLIGARGIVQALLVSGAIGLISTHDLALTEIAAAHGRLRNMHFEERIEDGEMHFDFKLRDGVVTTRNGVALMRMVGLKV